jgi:hypothetical protein
MISLSVARSVDADKVSAFKYLSIIANCFCSKTQYRFPFFLLQKVFFMIRYFNGSFFFQVFAVVTATIAGTFIASKALAQNDRIPIAFDVEFSDCMESIGVGLLPTEKVRSLVPTEFILAGDGAPVTPIVVRTARCGSISVDGRRARPGAIIQIGAVIVPPDFTGDINNYTLWYYTSNVELAVRLSQVGVDAQFVPTIDYDFVRCGEDGLFHVAVPLPGRPSLRLDGVVTQSNTPAGTFDANWWSKANGRRLKMNTMVPEIFIGNADLVLETRAQSKLGKLIGGDTLSFPILQQFNTFNRASMKVSVVAN